MNKSSRYMNNEKLNNSLENFEDIFETGPIPLIVAMFICILFNALAILMPEILKICFLVCGYIFLIFGILKTINNYD